MSKVLTDSKNYKDIAEAIRGKTGDTKLLKPEEMPAKVNSVYDAGKADLNKRMWDALTNNNTKLITDGTYVFRSFDFRNRKFNPPYTIKIGSYQKWCEGTFIRVRNLAELPTNTVDFSEAQWLPYCFAQADIKKIGILDLSSATALGAFMWNCTVEEVEKIVLHPTANVDFTSYDGAFYCFFLREIRFEGVIRTDIGFPKSPLSKASILNIFSVLSAEATGKTVTFNTSAVNTSFETSIGTADGSTSQEWLDLVATKSNWTIVLA